MLSYSIRRIAVSIPIVIVSSFVVFVMVATSGNPVNDLKARNPPPSPQVIHALEHRLWLDQGLFERYWHWIKGLVLHGNFGPSVNPTDNIRTEIVSRLGVTLRLVFAAMILALILAVVVGVISAVKQYSVTDYTATFFGFLFLAMPSFWLALLLKQGGIWANERMGDQVFYTIGEQSVPAPSGAWHNFTDITGHMILPTISLALISYAAWSRYQRGSMLEVLNSDYVRLARAKGLSNRRVMVKHALRTALIPLATVTALDLAGIIGGAIITETVFQWHGMGDYLLQSIRSRDVFAVEAWLLVFAIVVILFNLIADLLYAVLDPRIRYD